MTLQQWTQTWEGYCPAALLPKRPRRKWNRVLTEDDPMSNSVIAPRHSTSRMVTASASTVCASWMTHSVRGTRSWTSATDTPRGA